MVAWYGTNEYNFEKMPDPPAYEAFGNWYRAFPRISNPENWTGVIRPGARTGK